jgi:hypothetical protein
MGVIIVFLWKVGSHQSRAAARTTQKYCTNTNQNCSRGKSEDPMHSKVHDLPLPLHRNDCRLAKVPYRPTIQQTGRKKQKKGEHLAVPTQEHNPRTGYVGSELHITGYVGSELNMSVEPPHIHHTKYDRETFGIRVCSSDIDSLNKKGSARKRRTFRRSLARPLVHRPFEFRIQKPECHQQSLARVRLGHKEVALLVDHVKTAAHHAPSRLHCLGDLGRHHAVAPLAPSPAIDSVRLVCLRCRTPVLVTLVTAVAFAPLHARRVRHATLPAKLCIKRAEHVL